MGIRIKISGDPGTTKTAQMHHAVANHWRMAMEAKDRASRPKPKKPAQARAANTGHIRHWNAIK